MIIANKNLQGIFAAMDIQCIKEELEILKKIAAAATELQLPCYLIGGFVRDKIIGRSTKDMDIVCLGDGIALADAVAKKFSPKPEVSFFKNFGTAQIKIFNQEQPVEKNEMAGLVNTQVPSPLGKGRDGALEIEFVGARKESSATTAESQKWNPAHWKTIKTGETLPSMH